MQSFILDRHTDPNNPTMKVTQDEKIPVYDSLADAEADLANLEENQIVATKDSGATEKVVDVVQDGNMNAVTSNAVYDYVNDVETVTGTTTEGGGAYVIKRAGKVVTLAVYNMSITGARDILVLTLPVKFRPTHDVKVAGSYGGGCLSNDDMVEFSIRIDGDVYTYSYRDFVRRTAQLSATWIID